ncbi:HAD family hydrolase [Alicyclobacillus shizuokensis]|uniref:HAD family hydrolase n=1 Tax=Alicyclobacillus shizuokensis TaxID=392014 RepID=UPI000832A169|nr:HAD hydrolase-like protein [Alicyclobacillus shizuokensis]MCL6625382.1 HAD hydrolase-like protein [Alicyclobacillus shizuokensis]
MYDWILFDIDGVMLSEERYFDASALAVYELLASPQYLRLTFTGMPGFGVRPDDETVSEIRARVFHEDEFLRFIKGRGVNANWDMVYLQFVAVLAAVADSLPAEARMAWLPQELPVPSAGSAAMTDASARRTALVEALRQFVAAAPTMAEGVFRNYTRLFEHCRGKDDLFSVCRRVLEPILGDAAQAVWDLGKDVFQEWYLGDVYGGPAWHGQPAGKAGYLEQERPVVPPDEFRDLLDDVLSRGMRIGIATGRPRLETEVPLRSFDWLSRFDRNRVTTASEVLEAQALRPGQPLSKPHPFSYLRSYLGESDLEAVLDTPLPLPEPEGRRVLIVGDSVADALAARAMGCHFAAVLTGLDGADARRSFASLGCNYVLNNVLELKQVLAAGVK